MEVILQKTLPLPPYYSTIRGEITESRGLI